MCGIVVYYGNAHNPLTRVLTGMWAIVYRAPDSTGIGLIGNEHDPVKIRRELGSVSQLVDHLIESPVFDESELKVTALMEQDSGHYSDFIVENQKKLLALEGFDPATVTGNTGSAGSFPSWSDLTDPEKMIEAAPGTPGSPEIQEYIKINSLKAFKAAVRKMTTFYDLPLVVIEKLFIKALEHQVELRQKNNPAPVSTEELLMEFKQLFDSYAHDEIPVQIRPKKTETGPRHPYIRKYLWQHLKDMMVIIPSDYTTDGIANLFRRIDSCVLAGSIHSGSLDDRIQMIFEDLWTFHKSSPPVHWRNLYRTERMYNVYGLAAASILAFFRTESNLRYRIKTIGGTHPLLLQSMETPVIAQGRWAIQSPISVRNAHPFMDEKKQRSVVLNGQFNSSTESRVKEYITQVAGILPRSDNSTEFFALLWGFFFDTAAADSHRYRIIEKQYQLGLEDISSCSQTVDYGILKKLKHKTAQDMDEMAFIRAMEVMIMSGGQFAVSGISLVSRDRLFLGVHKRPVYIVKRRDTADFMIVSDINAALGLFPQSLIQSTSIELRKLMTEYARKSVIVEPGFFNQAPDSEAGWFRRRKMDILAPFQVDIYALDQEHIFAKIQTAAGSEKVLRHLEIRDFSGKIRTDIQPDTTYLSPMTFKKDFGKTFYEEHLHEIPGLLDELINRYVTSNDLLPVFDIKDRLLTRRFGAGLASLNRIILVGTGFSYELALLVKKNMESFFSGINISVTTPMDMETVDAAINPDRDLVVMISWSGTTADMIDFASLLHARNVLMVGITEKPFSDMGLILKKSAGVIPVSSGEEATVTALKSAVCTLFVLNLFCLHIQRITSGSAIAAASLVQELKSLPEKIESILTDHLVIDFCRKAAHDTRYSKRHYFVDALHHTGSAKFGALNLELNAWTSMGTAMDYSEAAAFAPDPMARDSLVLVNATSSDRLQQGIDAMTELQRAGKPFYAVTYNNLRKNEMAACTDHLLVLPKVADYFQPFIDIPFMCLFGFYFGLAHGRLAGEMPRNMAKSITAGRTKDGSGRQASDRLDDLELKNRVLPDLPAGLMASANVPCWTTKTRDTGSNKYYSDLSALCEEMAAPDPFEALFSTPRPDMMPYSDLVFSHLAEDGIIVFVPMDKQAEAGCINFIRLWQLFFTLPLQMEYPEKIKGIPTQDSLVIGVASTLANETQISDLLVHSGNHFLFIGPESNAAMSNDFIDAMGAFYLKNPDRQCPGEHIYLALCQFFLAVTARRLPDRARCLQAHFRLCLPAVNTLFQSKTLEKALHTAVTDNRPYKKALFVTSLKGSCIAWEYQFKSHRKRNLESEPFGVSAYSRLVLVDPDHNAKYIKIAPRSEMAVRYCENDIAALEQRYLGGAMTDEFLTDCSMPLQADAALPFMVEGHWFVPALNPDYDTDRDCLVIIDATSEDHFDAALDELATFGSRHARLIVITQEAFSQDARLTNLKKYPLSQIILVPGLKGPGGDITAFSDFILPIVTNVIGMALAEMDV